MHLPRRFSSAAGFHDPSGFPPSMPTRQDPLSGRMAGVQNRLIACRRTATALPEVSGQAGLPRRYTPKHRPRMLRDGVHHARILHGVSVGMARVAGVLQSIWHPLPLCFGSLGQPAPLHDPAGPLADYSTCSVWADLCAERADLFWPAGIRYRPHLPPVRWLRGGPARGSPLHWCMATCLCSLPQQLWRPLVDSRRRKPIQKSSLESAGCGGIPPP